MSLGLATLPAMVLQLPLPRRRLLLARPALPLLLLLLLQLLSPDQQRHFPILSLHYSVCPSMAPTTEWLAMLLLLLLLGPVDQDSTLEAIRKQGSTEATRISISATVPHHCSTESVSNCVERDGISFQ